MKEINYRSVIEAIAPLKTIEALIIDMEKQHTENPECLPMHYKFITSVITSLQELQKQIKEAMIEA